MYDKKKHSKNVRNWQLKNPEKVRLYKRNHHRRKSYGLSPEAYNKMAQRQNNRCALCGQLETSKDFRTGKARTLSVDHNHKTNKIRQLLCHRCNLGLGMFKDDIDLLQKVVKYLKKHKKNSISKSKG